MAKRKNKIPRRTSRTKSDPSEEQSEKAREWLEENMGFRPHGYEW